MGIVASRPEDPFEWAGIPSEPERPDDEAERPADAVGVDPAGLAGSGFGSLAVPADIAVGDADRVDDGTDRASDSDE